MTAPVEGPVLVVGSGLLGTSIGLALRRAGVHVWLDDSDPSVVAEAVALGAGEPLPKDGQPAIVVAAVPPGAAGQVMARACEFPGATVTDVTSVKARPLAEAMSAGGDPARIVGGHPLAGRELSGPGAARRDLFDDRVWVVCPGAAGDPARVQQVVDLAVTCGAVPVSMTPEEHDAAVAMTSHAPQVLSSLLAARLLDADAESIAVSGQALRDMTRIAASDPGLWQEILRANAASVADVLDELASDLRDVVADLRGSAEAGPLADALQRGNAGRSRVPGKHGAVATEYALIAVMLQDRPGELARLVVAVGDLDVNLEDIRIDHVLGKPSGLIELFVRPESEQSLEAGLRAMNFDVRS